MNRQGSTLVMTIFLVMLMSVLALSLFTIMVTDKKLVVQQEDGMQSYYLARSGADIVAEQIINNPFDIQLLDGLTSVEYTGIGEGSFQVAVNIISTLPDGEIETVQLLSVGSSEERSNSIELILDRITMDHAIFTNEDLDVGSMGDVHGDLGSNGTVDDVGASGRSGYDNYEYMDLVIHTQTFPSGLANYGNIDENSNYSFDYGSADIQDIRLNIPSGEITFETNDVDLEIVVDDWYIKGGIVVNGSGRVLLYVKSIANFQTPSLNTNDPDQFIIYLDAGAAISLSTPLGFNGRIIGPEATVIMTAGSSIYGAVIADEFFGTSNSNIYYDAPSSGSLVTGFKRDEWK